MSRLVGFYFPNILSERGAEGGRLQGVNCWISWPTSGRGASPLFHTRHRHNFSPSHTPEGLSIPRLMRTWYDENLWTNKQHCPVSALSGLVSLPWLTQSDDKMGRDNGKLTRPGGITPDLARSIAYMILSVKENWIAESETFSSLTSC